MDDGCRKLNRELVKNGSENKPFKVKLVCMNGIGDEFRFFYRRYGWTYVLAILFDQLANATSYTLI